MSEIRGHAAQIAMFYIAIQLQAQGLLGGVLAAPTAALADPMSVIDPRLGLHLVIGATLSMGIWRGHDLPGAFPSNPRIAVSSALYFSAKRLSGSRTHSL